MSKSSERPNSRSWLRFLYLIVVWLLLLITLLILGLYGISQSSFFYRSILFPQLSKSLGGTLTVDKVSVELTRNINLKGVHFKDHAGNDNRIDHLILRYRPFSLILGRAELEEIFVQNAFITLDAFIGNVAKPIEEDPSTAPSGDPNALYPKLLLRILVDKARLRNVNISAGGKALGATSNSPVLLKNISLNIDRFTGSDGGEFGLAFELKNDGTQKFIPEHAKGVLESNIQLQPDREKAGTQFSLQLSELEGNSGPVQFKSDAVSLKGQVSGTTKSLNVKNLDIEGLTEGVKYLQASLNGEIRFDNKPSKASLKITELHDEILNLVLQKREYIENTIISGELSSQFSFEGLGTFSGKLEAKDLKLLDSSSIPSDLQVTFEAINEKDSLLVKQFDSSLSQAEQPVFDFKLNGAFAKTSPSRIEASLDVNRLNIDGLLSTLPNSQKSPPEKKGGKNEGSPLVLPRLPELTFILQSDLHIGEMSVGDLAFKDGSAKVSLQSEQLRVEDLDVHLNDAPITGSLFYRTTESSPALKGRVESENFQLERFFPTTEEQGTPSKVRGTVTKLQVLAKNRTNGDGSVTNEFEFDARAKFKNLIVPAYLQDTPPVNLLFLPIDVLDETVGTIGKLLLPSAITDMTSSINSRMKDAGQIKFDTAQVRTLVHKDGVEIEDTNFDGNIVPTLTFHGRIGFNEKLNMTIGIELLKIPVPLPVGGTLSVPLPDIASFLPEVIRSLGLGLVNIGGMFVPEDEAQFFKNQTQESEMLETDDSKQPPKILTLERRATSNTSADTAGGAK